MNVSALFRYYAILLVLFTAHSFAGINHTPDTGSIDSAIVQLSIDSGETNDSPTDGLLSSVSTYQTNKYHPVRTLDKKSTFFTTTHFVTQPRAPPVL
jgi:hypothetical protein